MGSVFEPNDLSKKTKKKISNNSMEDIIPKTNDTSENK